MGIGIAYVLREAAQSALAKKDVYEVKLPASIKFPQVSLDLVYAKEYLTKGDREFIKKYITEDTK